MRWTDEELSIAKSHCPDWLTMASWLRALALNAAPSQYREPPLSTESPLSVPRAPSPPPPGTRGHSPSDRNHSGDFGTDRALSSASSLSVEAPDPERARAKGQSGLPLDEVDEVDRVIAYWQKLGEPFTLVAHDALTLRAKGLLTTYRDLDWMRWSFEAAARWTSLPEEQRKAIGERRPWGKGKDRRKNSGGVPGWVSDQMRIRDTWRKEDEKKRALAEGQVPESSRRAHEEHRARVQAFREGRAKIVE